MTILEAADNWKTAMMIDQPRGSVIYCYLEPESDVQQIKLQTQAFLQKMAREKNQKIFPILVIFFADRDGVVGQTLAEMTILEKNLDSHEKQQFGNLIENHKAKCITLLLETMHELALERHYVFLGAPASLESPNIKNICSLLFENVYPHVLPFPFDGFASSRGNAADTCYSLTLELISGHMTYDDIMRKPPKEKNRAIEVLNQCWNVFLPTGDISRTPANLSLNSIFGIWEKQINNEGNIVTMADLILTACEPPFGANIPSSGLALGVFLCARQKNLALQNHGKDIYLSEISAEMLFHGKNLDLDKLKYMVSIPSEEKISEWEAFLDAWEAAGKISYKDQIDYYDKSIVLKEKVRPPKEQTYRLELLEDQSKTVKEKVESTEKKVERIERKFEEAGQYDLHELSFCAVKIREILDVLRADFLLTKLFDVERMKEDIDKIRQQSIQTFPDWIKRQSPRGRTTRDASDFSKYMKETSINMRKLSLNDLADAIEEKSLEALRQIDTLAEAQNLYENALSWLKANINKRAPRITELRDAVDTAKGYLKEAIDVQNKIQTPDIDSLIEQLNIFITDTRAEEEKIKNRFVKTMDWDFNLCELNEMITKLNGFFEVFQGSEKDLEEIRSMQGVLGFYRNSFERVCSEHLNETELFDLFHDIEQEVKIYDESEPLWISEDVLPILFKEAERKRYESGERWSESIDREIAQLKELTVAEASKLYDRIQKYPPYLTSAQREKALKNSQQIEQHLNSLKVKWLIQKFKELDHAARKIFLNIILSEPHD
ncbi:MAG: hypothetical protein EOM62_08845 [Bacteroidia bacterium]|nr:hypothetical protein [Bacteroidia bacterium]